MKSLFKRAFAAATSSVLVLSQLAATAVNINAADAQPLVVDKAWTLKVPFEDQKDALTTYLDPIEVNAEETEATFAAGTETVNDLHSKWNDDFETALLAALGSKDSVENEVNTAALRGLIKTMLSRPKAISSTAVEEVSNAISDKGTATLYADGYSIVTADLDMDSAAMAKILQEELKSRGREVDIADLLTGTVDAHMTGKVLLMLDYRNFDKKIDYVLTFVDQNGETQEGLGGLGTLMQQSFKNYLNSLSEKGQGDIADLVKQYTSDIIGKELDTDEAFGFGMAQADEFMGKVQELTLSGTDPNQVYKDYYAKIDEIRKDMGLTDEMISKADDKVASADAETYKNKVPETLSEALLSQQGTNLFKQLTDMLKGALGNQAQVNLATSDINEIVTTGYNWDIQLPNGYSADSTFDYPLEADELASLTSMVKEIKEAEYITKYNKQIVAVEAHKKVTSNFDNDYTAFSGSAFYDVELIIDKIILEEVVTTETTSSTTESSTTESSSTTEGSSTTESSSTTEGSSTTESSSTTEGSSTTESSSTTEGSSTTESSSTTEGSSTTESSSTTEGSSTTESSSTTEGSSTTESSSTTEGSSTTESSSTTEGSSTTESSTTSSTETSTNTTDSSTTSSTETSTNTTNTTTEPLPAVSLEFVVSGMPAELIYWSEEDTPFDFVNCKIIMNINLLEGDRTTYYTDDSIDVSAAFDALQKSPKDFEFHGFDKYSIQYACTDVAAIQKAITDAGYDADELSKQENLTDGFLADGYTPLYLVLRGDWNLDNTVSQMDAKMTQDYVVATSLSVRTAKEAFDDGDLILPNGMYEYLRFSHYAADVQDGIGVITLTDAKMIQNYANATYLTYINEEGNWIGKGDPQLEKNLPDEKVVPLEKLHSEPLTYDEWVD